LADTVNVTAPEPVADVRDSPIHEAAEVAVHPHPVAVVTVTLCVPPVPGSDAVVGDTLKVHAAAAACVTVTACPATVTVAERGCAVGFAPIVRVTVAVPLPLAGATETQDALALADQGQPAEAVTVMLDVPPPLAMAALVGATT
jgi:hypothetical protein